MISGSSRWVICGLLFLATTLNYLDRQTLSILAPTIQKELHLNNSDLGWLFSVFYYTYTFAQFVIGPLLDRWNLRWAYGIAVLAWSSVAALTGLVTSFTGLLMFRMLLGVMEAANWPAALRVVARTLPPAERSMGNGIFTSGTSIGALIAPALILGIAHAWGWRQAFVVVGSLGLIWFVAWIFLTRGEHLRAVWREEAEQTASGGNVYRDVLSSGAFWRVFCVTSLVNPCLYYNLNWLPTYFVQQRGLTDVKWPLTLIYLGLDLGYLSCGAGVILLMRRGWKLPASRSTVFTAATALMALSAAVPFIVDNRIAIATLVIVNFGIGAWISMYLTMAQEVSSKHISAAAGLLGGSGSLTGAFAMWAVGRITRDSHDFTVPMIGIAVVAVILAVAGWAVVRHARREELIVA